MSSAASAPGTARGFDFPNPFILLANDEIPSRTYAAPPSSSLLNANGVTWPLAPGGRYAPAGFEGVFTDPRYFSAEACGVGTGENGFSSSGSAERCCGRQQTWYSSLRSSLYISPPPACQILIPLSTRSRGDVVAVKICFPSGDHSQTDALLASMVHIFAWSLSRS